MRKVALIYDEIFLKHNPGNWHPESPYRLESILKRVEREDIKNLVEILPPEKATKEEILWNHTEELYELIAQTSGKSYFTLDPDTSTNEYSFESALYAVGAQKKALKLLFENKFDYVFALVRPPGHHAERDRAMGFCLFNNVALAAYYAKHYHGLNRILIIDFDLHHGNGTQKSFYDDPEVMFFSTHQYPFYPGTGNYTEIGTKDGRGYNINVPLKSGLGDNEFIFFYKELLEPISLQFKPQIILVSAGFDSLKGDPLGGLNLTLQGLSNIIKIVQIIANRTSKGKILFTLEGGYNLQNLAEGVATIIQTLTGTIEIKEPYYEKTSLSPYAIDLYHKISELLKFKWQL
ncbi:MAG: histone deacetylase [Caldimicrobium sp.]